MKFVLCLKFKIRHRLLRLKKKTELYGFIENEFFLLKQVFRNISKIWNWIDEIIGSGIGQI